MDYFINKTKINIMKALFKIHSDSDKNSENLDGLQAPNIVWK
jgi:hypothetical protein